MKLFPLVLAALVSVGSAHAQKSSAPAATAPVAPASSFTLLLSKSTVAPGETVNVKITVSSVTRTARSFAVTYSKKNLSLVTVPTSVSLPASATTVTFPVKVGTILIATNAAAAVITVKGGDKTASIEVPVSSSH